MSRVSLPRLDLIGRFRVEPAARPIAKKARALLAYLAWHGGGYLIDREILVDLLWPHQDGEAGRHSLRNCLWQLGRAGLANLLQADLETVRIRADSDLARFRAAVEAEDFRGAAVLVRGPLLDHFPEISEPFDQWLRRARASFGREAAAMLRHVVADLLAGGEFDKAVDQAVRLVAFDEIDEASHRLLLRAYMAAGRRNAAVRHYRDLALMLRRELGVAPEPATQALLAAVL